MLSRISTLEECGIEGWGLNFYALCWSPAAISPTPTPPPQKKKRISSPDIPKLYVEFVWGPQSPIPEILPLNYYKPCKIGPKAVGTKFNPGFTNVAYSKPHMSVRH